MTKIATAFYWLGACVASGCNLTRRGFIAVGAGYALTALAVVSAAVS